MKLFVFIETQKPGLWLTVKNVESFGFLSETHNLMVTFIDGATAEFNRVSYFDCFGSTNTNDNVTHKGAVLV